MGATRCLPARDPDPVTAPRGRARFGAGVLVGMALTGAAVGGYAIGQQDELGLRVPSRDRVDEPDSAPV